MRKFKFKTDGTAINAPAILAGNVTTRKWFWHPETLRMNVQYSTYAFYSPILRSWYTGSTPPLLTWRDSMTVYEKDTAHFSAPHMRRARR